MCHPHSNDWRTACCNFDNLSLLRKKVFEEMHLTDPKDSRNKEKPQRIVEEVEAFRICLRTSKYLADPLTPGEHRSLSGEALDEHLYKFCEIARAKRAQYVTAYIQHEKTAHNRRAAPPSFKEPPVPVTLEESQSMKQKMKRSLPELQREVENALQAIADINLRDSLESVLQEVSALNDRSLMLHLLDEVKVFVDSENSYADASSNEDNDGDD
jgi:hypothetical protein